MKRYLYFVLIICICYSSSLIAQFERDHSILPSAGDQYQMIINNNKRLYSIPSGGANKSFDFSSLMNDGERLIEFDGVTNSIFVGANIKTSLADEPPIDVYMLKNTKDLIIRGVVPSVSSGFPFPLSFAFYGNLKYMTSPIKYDMTPDKSSDKSSLTIPAAFINQFVNIDSMIYELINSGVISLPGGFKPNKGDIKTDSIQVRLNISNTISCDAFGKISTPLESNVDVLRVVRKIQFDYEIWGYFTINVPFLGPQKIPFELTSFIASELPSLPQSIMHSYYDSKSNIEVVSAIADTSGNHYMQIFYRKSSSSGSSSSLHLNDNNSPNLFFYNNLLKISDLQDIDAINIYDIAGKQIASAENQSEIKNLETMNFGAGIYIVNVNINGSIVNYKLINY